MANVIKLRKGLDINLKGKAAEELSTVKEPGFYALVPDDCQMKKRIRPLRLRFVRNY